MTGKVEFDAVGDRIANATVSQWFNGSPTPIGLSYGDSIMELYGGVNWPGGVIPSDGIEYALDSIGLVHYTITSLVAVVAGLISIVYILLTVVYWRRKVIQAYQPMLTIVMLLGECICLLRVV